MSFTTHVAERCNSFPYDAERNASASILFTKMKGYRNFRVKAQVAFTNPIATGKVVELDCVVVGVGEALTVGIPYRQAKVFREGIRPTWYDVSFRFTGFPLEEMVMHVTLERRSDATTHGTPSQSLMLIRKTSGISET